MEPDVVNLTFCPTTLGLATDESAIEMTGLGLVTSLQMMMLMVCWRSEFCGSAEHSAR